MTGEVAAMMRCHHCGVKTDDGIHSACGVWLCYMHCHYSHARDCDVCRAKRAMP